MAGVIWTISSFIVCLTCLVLVFIILRYGSKKAQYIWALFNLAVGIWGLGSFFAGLSRDNLTAMLFWKIAITGAVPTTAIFYHVIVVLGELKRKAILIILYSYAFIFYSLFVLDLTGAKAIYSYDSLYYLRATDFRLVVLLAIWSATVFYAMFELYKLFRRTSGNKQTQFKYLFIATGIGWVGALFIVASFIGFNIFPIGNTIMCFYSPLATYAILRHQLLEIEVIVKKTIVYSISISIITIFYFIIVYLLERIFNLVIGYQSLYLTIVIITIFSILFTPLKNKIQHSIDKYFFKGTIDQIEHEKTLLGTELEHSERLKTVSTLAAGMAHEIKNPLTSIKTFAEFVDKKHQDPEFRRKFNSIVPKEIDRITDIINQLLDYSKTDRTALRNVNIHKMLDYILDLDNSEFIKKHIEIEKLYHSKSPTITCAENQIKQAFINIILNSIEAMPSSGKLVVQTKDVDGTLEICIQDTGAGIPKAELKNLFDPFYTTKEKGTGLGLFIVHQIIENNKGKITIASEVNKGTLVTVRFAKG